MQTENKSLPLTPDPWICSSFLLEWEKCPVIRDGNYRLSDCPGQVKFVPDMWKISMVFRRKSAKTAQEPMGTHISVTTGPTKMVHLSKFAEFYHKISQNILVTIYLNNYFKKCKKKNYPTESLKALRTGNFFQHLSTPAWLSLVEHCISVYIRYPFHIL